MRLPHEEPAGAGLDAPARRTLLAAARAAIAEGVAGRRPVPPPLAGHPAPLCAITATFVTLERAGALRGCVGTLDACRPLLVDAALNAHAAALEDPRFEPLARAELADLEIHVSILSRPQPLAFRSEAELLALLRPGIDGLILRDGGRRGTFLPAVWQALADAPAFLGALKRKLGLPADYWSDTIEAWRYTTVTVS